MWRAGRITLCHLTCASLVITRVHLQSWCQECWTRPPLMAFSSRGQTFTQPRLDYSASFFLPFRRLLLVRKRTHSFNLLLVGVYIRKQSSCCTYSNPHHSWLLSFTHEEHLRCRKPKTCTTYLHFGHKGIHEVISQTVDHWLWLIHSMWFTDRPKILLHDLP